MSQAGQHRAGSAAAPPGTGGKAPEGGGAKPGRPSLLYRGCLSLFRLLVRAYFREVRVVGTEEVPRDRGGLVVSWHPNGLVDPGLILTTFPRRIVFGARHGLFRVPLLGALMRAIGTIPIYRAMDQAGVPDEVRRARNRESLDALAAEIAGGAFSALFPEGVSHDDPHLAPLRTGAARLYYRARALSTPGRPPPVIVPVGLHYDHKRSFRSHALVEYHPPIALPPHLDVTPGPEWGEAERRDLARALTEEIERALAEVVQATEDWEVHHLLHRVRKIVRAERSKRRGVDPGPSDIEERTLAFARVRTAYYARVGQDPEGVARLRDRIRDYDADLRALRMEDHELDRPPDLFRPWLAAALALQVVTVFLLVPPILLVGYAVNGPPALVIKGLCKVVAQKKKDEASWKALAGAVLFPLTWLGVGAAGFFGYEQLHASFPAVPEVPLLAGALLAGLSVAGGFLALRYLRVAAETARALRVRLTRRRRRQAVARLLAERAALYDALTEMAEGLDLPGAIAPDGTVRRAPVT